jgi:hypothetical protein
MEYYMMIFSNPHEIKKKVSWGQITFSIYISIFMLIKILEVSSQYLNERNENFS